MDFYKRALELREETISHRRWLHSNAEVGLHILDDFLSYFHSIS